MEGTDLPGKNRNDTRQGSFLLQDGLGQFFDDVPPSRYNPWTACPLSKQRFDFSSFWEKGFRKKNVQLPKGPFDI
jgi:hypothetical protein